MCLTAHFIDSDWHLHKRILNFCIVKDYKGPALGKLIDQCLIKYGIDKILTITLDNASSNNGLIEFIIKKKTLKRKSTLLNHDCLHVRYAAHILNLIVKDGLKDIDESVGRIRNAVKYVRSS